LNLTPACDGANDRQGRNLRITKQATPLVACFALLDATIAFPRLNNWRSCPMRAAVYERTGPAREVLKVIDVATPVPGPGEVRVNLQ